MHRLKFYKLSPSGNITLLFEGLHHTVQDRHDIASLGLTKLGGEQAGFVDINKGILQMAGGEFCINATRSLGLLMALHESDGNIKSKMSFDVEVSGFDTSLTVQVEPMGEDVHVALSVPLQSMPPISELDVGVYLVQLQGIIHVLLDEKNHAFDAQNWQQASAHIREKYNLEQEVAVGCMWWHEDRVQKKDAKNLCYLHMHPIVRVLKPWALHYENACGSGVLALGLWHYIQCKQSQFMIKQPGGYLTLDLQEDIQGLKGIIGGPVQMVASGDF